MRGCFASCKNNNDGGLSPVWEEDAAGCNSLWLFPIIWFGYEDYCINYDNTVGTIPTLDWLIDKLNIQFFNDKGNDIVFVDLKRLIANVGISDAYENKNTGGMLLIVRQ